MDAPRKIWRDDLALAMMSGWVNCPVDKLPPEMRAHTCEATAVAWGRVADAARHYLAAEHERIVAEKDAEIARLVSERQRVDRRIKNQRAQLAWWNKLFHERLAAACRRRIYYPNWTPVLYRRAKARRAIKGDDNLRAAREGK